MDNPYKILGVGRNASKKEIQAAEREKTLENQITKQYTTDFIRKCTKILFEPNKRLAADFLFPAKLKAYRPKPIKLVEFKNTQIDLPSSRNNTLNKMKEFYGSN